MKSAIQAVIMSSSAFAASTIPSAASAATEQPRYEVIKQWEGVELRKYEPYLVAEVTVEAQSMSEASSRGFRPLAGYIFGNNRGDKSIAMTAPVTTQARMSGTRIAMTAPVTASEKTSGLYTVRFSMPAKWTMDTLPEPLDSRVKLRRVPAEYRLAYRFVGRRTQSRIDKAETNISQVMQTNQLEADSSLIMAGYDGPRVPPSQKRWEIMQVVR